MPTPLTVEVEVTDVLKDILQAIQMVTEELKIMEARIQRLEAAK